MTFPGMQQFRENKTTLIMCSGFQGLARPALSAPKLCFLEAQADNPTGPEDLCLHIRRRVVSLAGALRQQIHQIISVLPKLVLFLYSGFYLTDNLDQEQT